MAVMEERATLKSRMQKKLLMKKTLFSWRWRVKLVDCESYRRQLGEDLLLGVKVSVGALLTSVLLLQDLDSHVAMVPLRQVDVGELCSE